MQTWTGDEPDILEERSLIRGGVTALSHVFLTQLARVRAVRLQLFKFDAETAAPLSGGTAAATSADGIRHRLTLHK